MRAHQFVSELRRNPEQNQQRDRGYATVVELLKGRDLTRIGISMTHLPKLGINPQSTYDTPIGIYFYPADYYLELGGRVPFQKHAPYIQVFEYTGRILDVEHYDWDQYLEDMTKLADIYEGTYFEMMISKFRDEAEDQAKFNTPVGRMWYVLWRTSEVLANPEGEPRDSSRIAAHSPSVTWNRLLRRLGYDVVVDPGHKVIHEGEPTQGVVLNPRVIRPIQPVQNRQGARYHDTVGQMLLDPNTAYVARWIAKTAITDPQYLQPDTDTNLPKHVRRTPGKIHRLFERFIEILAADPNLWNQLGFPDDAQQSAEAVARAAPTKLKTQIIRLYQQSLQPQSGSRAPENDSQNPS